MVKSAFGMLKTVVLMVTLLNTVALPQKTYAQNANTSVSCGTTVTGELTKKNEIQTYLISLQPDDTLTVIGQSKGTTLFFGIRVFDPIETYLEMNDKDGQARNNPTISVGPVSARGDYFVKATNADGIYGWGNGSWPRGKGVGQYTLTFRCFRDGKEIKPSTPPPATDKAPIPDPKAQDVTESPFSGYGVPAQSSIDFANVESTSIISGEPIKDAIDSNATTPALYTLDAKAKQTLDLSFKRVSGNVNMGIAVVGPDNKVLFQVSLIASDAFNTKLVLPADGKYTIGVYRVELKPPAKPKATSFELTATVN